MSAARRLALLAGLLLAPLASAQDRAAPSSAIPAATTTGTVPAADPWSPFRPLLGEWVAEPSGRPGEPVSASASFALDLDGHVLVRKNHVRFSPRPGGLTGPVHDDLMVIGLEGGAPRAIFWDSEGHVIRYAVTSAAGAITLESEPGPGPRFRLDYAPLTGGRYDVTFSIAAPGQPLRPHQSGVIRRR